MQLYPNLSFDGRCEAAFRFYAECLHATIAFMMTYEDTPMDLGAPPEWRGKLSHATLAHPDFTLHGSDALPGNYERPRGFALQLNLSDPAEAERIFGALSQNGSVEAPLAETFWALRFAVLTDAFGVPWVINCERPEPSTRDSRARSS